MKTFKVFFEDNENSKLNNNDIRDLINAFDQIKEPYSRYLSVFNYFDPNSLGTISEVLLTKLVNTIDGVTADHVGAGQGLADLIVNGHPISLKTTKGSVHIGLGKDEQNTNPADVKELLKNLNIIYDNNPEYRDYTVAQLQSVIDPEVYKLIYNRLTSIARKLSGDENKEFFVWVEKIFKKDILSKIIIHVVKYDYDKVLKLFLDNIIQTTASAWGLKDKNNNKAIIATDTSGKLLNITPYFVRQSSRDQTVTINLITNIRTKPEDIKEKLPAEFFKSLDTIYSNIFGKSTEQRAKELY